MRTILCFSLLLWPMAFVFGEPAEKAPPLIAKPGALRTLVKPDCSHCKDEAERRGKQLKDDDRVLCWIRGYSDGGAIPLRFYLSHYRVISDTYGVFVHDADAGFVRAFEPSVDFTFYGWRNGVMVLKHKNGTLYSALSGRVIDGPQATKNPASDLKPIATLESDWGNWLKTYPNAVAFKMYFFYQPVDLPTKPNEDSLRSRSAPDTRLRADTPVLGLRVGSKTKAYPLTVLEKSDGVLADVLDGEKVAIFTLTGTRTAVAYSIKNPGGDGTLTFRKDDKHPLAPFIDQESGSRWDIAGRAVEGPLKGKTLTWLDGVQVQWFAWSAEYPETGIFP